jgi:hypothetical protein
MALVLSIEPEDQYVWKFEDLVDVVHLLSLIYEYFQERNHSIFQSLEELYHKQNQKTLLQLAIEIRNPRDYRFFSLFMFTIRFNICN